MQAILNEIEYAEYLRLKSEQGPRVSFEALRDELLTRLQKSFNRCSLAKLETDGLPAYEVQKIVSMIQFIPAIAEELKKKL